MKSDDVRDGQVVVVLVGELRRPVGEVDPKTRQTTGRAKQFKVSRRGDQVSLMPLKPADWVAEPAELEVDNMRF